jgi:hypothetical protein
MEGVDWLTLENKVRKLVKELVEPTIRRALENRDALEKLKKREAIMQEKIDEQELGLAKVTKKVGTMDDFSRKLMEFEASMRMFEAQIAHAKESMLTESDGLNKKIVYLEEMVKVLEHQREQQRSDMNYTNQVIVDMNTELIRRITALAEIENNNNTAIKERVTGVEERINTMEAYNKVMQESLGNAETNIERLRKNLEETNESVVKMRDSIKSLRDEQNEKINTGHKQIIAHGTQMQQSLLKFGQFLESDYAIKMQFTISEILHHCLDLKQRKKLAGYEKLKMQLLEQSGKAQEYSHDLHKLLERANHVLESTDNHKDIDTPNSASSKSIHRAPHRSGNVRNSKSRRVMTQIHNSGGVHMEENQEGSYERDESVLSINSHSEYNPISRGSQASLIHEKEIEEGKTTRQHARGHGDSTPRETSVRAVRDVRNYRNQGQREAEHNEGSVNRTRRSKRRPIHEEQDTHLLADPAEESKQYSRVNSISIQEDPQAPNLSQEVHNSRRSSNRTQKTARGEELDPELRFNRVSSINSRAIDSRSDSISSQHMIDSNTSEKDARFTMTGGSVLRNLEGTSEYTRNSSIRSGEPVKASINRKITENVMEGSEIFSPSPMENENELYPEEEMMGDSQHIEDGSLPAASDEGMMIYYTESHEQLLEDLRNGQEDIEKRMEDNYQDLVVQIDDIKTHLLDLVAKKTDELKKQNASLEALAQQAIWECNTATKQRKRDFSDNRAQFQKITSTLENINKHQNELDDYIELHKRVLEALIEFCRIDQALSSQDEEDRDSIVLMGYKENTRDTMKPKIISIEKTCLSCTSQSSVVLSAFKMACLQYQPSSVSYNRQPYNRKELLHIRGRLLEALPFVDDLGNSTKEMLIQANGARTIDSIQIM